MYLNSTPEFFNCILIIGTQQYHFGETGIFLHFVVAVVPLPKLQSTTT